MESDRGSFEAVGWPDPTSAAGRARSRSRLGRCGRRARIRLPRAGCASRHACPNRVARLCAQFAIRQFGKLVKGGCVCHRQAASGDCRDCVCTLDVLLRKPKTDGPASVSGLADHVFTWPSRNGLRSGRWLRGSGTEAERRSARSKAAVERRAPRAGRKPRAPARPFSRDERARSEARRAGAKSAQARSPTGARVGHGGSDADGGASRGPNGLGGRLLLGCLLGGVI